MSSISALEANMKKRGGGLIDIELIVSTEVLEGYYQLHCTFETLNAMGANFINSCLEEIAKTFESLSLEHDSFKEQNAYPEVIMSILSNYVPECLVRAEVNCTLDQLSTPEIDGKQFAEKFISAIEIAKAETKRAVTHNKGIMNGIDAMIIATGNDFRAVEAGIHAYAARNGKYTSLTDAYIKDENFYFNIEVPMALGTVGGLTSLHPLVSVAHKLLQNPDAHELMQLVAVAGLAQNFAAIRSLVTTGIQKGHMKMHLLNILNQLKASDHEKEQALLYFKDRAISHIAVDNFVEQLRR